MLAAVFKTNKVMFKSIILIKNFEKLHYQNAGHISIVIALYLISSCGIIFAAN